MLAGESDRLGWVGELGEMADEAQVGRDGQNGGALVRKRHAAGQCEECRFFFFSEPCHKRVRTPQVYH